MKHAPTKISRTTLGLAALGLVGGMLAPSTAEAQVRVNGLAGVARIGSPSLQVPAVAGTLRVEGLMGVLPWLELGGYGEAIADVSAGTYGSSFGAIVEARPHLPGLSFDPMAYASAGYLRYPVGNGQLSGMWNGQLGLGVTLHVNTILDVDLRGGLVQSLSRDESALNARGWTASFGISLHP